MAATLPPPLSLSFTPTLATNRNPKNQTSITGSNNKPTATTTPLLINHTPRPRTKHQLLDQVLADLQLSLSQGVPLEPRLLTSLLETCHRLRSPHHAVRLHRLIPRPLLRRSAALSSKLLRLYAELGLVDQAQQLFDEMPKRVASAFPSNSLIAGYAEAGRYEEAMAVYYQMEEDGVAPDSHTFPRVLKACGGIGDIRIGEAVHRHMVRSGFGTDPFVLNALVAMYAKCGDIVKARKIFDKLVCRDSVSWNTMVTGYLRHGLFHEAVWVFRVMVNERIRPDSVAISSVLAGTDLLAVGLEIHGWVVRNGEESKTSIMNSLISLYGRHGAVRKASILFDGLCVRDVVSWNAMIKCYSGNHRALLLFQQMECGEVLPDRVTFVSLLSTCATLGLVDEGKRLFAKMEGRYGIRAGVEHYGCMVNMLGRAGLVEEAYRIAQKSECEGSVTAWGALLYACSVHGNVEIGEVAADRLFDLEPDNRENFELLRKVYRDGGRLQEEERITRMMLARGLDYSIVTATLCPTFGLEQRRARHLLQPPNYS